MTVKLTANHIGYHHSCFFSGEHHILKIVIGKHLFVLGSFTGTLLNDDQTTRENVENGRKR